MAGWSTGWSRGLDGTIFIGPRGEVGGEGTGQAGLRRSLEQGKIVACDERWLGRLRRSPPLCHDLGITDEDGMPGVLAASAIEPRLHGLQVIVGCFDASQGVVGDAWRWIIERKSMMHVRTCGIQGALAKKRDRKRNMGGMMIAEPVQDSLAILTLGSKRVRIPRLASNHWDINRVSCSLASNGVFSS